MSEIQNTCNIYLFFINYFTRELQILTRFNSEHYITDVIKNTRPFASKYWKYERVKRTPPVNLSCGLLASTLLMTRDVSIREGGRRVIECGKFGVPIGRTEITGEVSAVFLTTTVWCSSPTTETKNLTR
jgi:hypothetical protein